VRGVAPCGDRTLGLGIGNRLRAAEGGFGSVLETLARPHGLSDTAVSAARYPPRVHRRVILTLVGLAVLLLAAVAVRLGVGGIGATPEQTAEFVALRAGRVASGVVVGAALAVAGVLLQSLLRNPLASPDLLGLASGSGLGIMIAIYAAYLGGGGLAHAGLGRPAATAAALVGALASLGFVYLFSQRRGLLDPITLVLVGVVIGILCGAGIALIRHLLPDQGVAANRLLLGALPDDVPPRALVAVGGVTLLCVALGAWAGPAMDAASLGDDEARSLGVPLTALRTLLFVLSGVLTAASVVLAGPIGFVGLVCPHLVRLLAGPAHRPLVLGSALAGASLVVLADALVRSVDLGAGRPPISVLTALVGGPVLIAMLRKTRF